jgi:5-methylcytosine-specific restriction endonuclease McrA
MSKRRSNQPWYFRYVKAQLRRIWGWAPERKEAKKRASIGKDGRGNELFRCERCNEQPLTRKQVEVDHLVEADNVGEWDGWDNFINRLFCPAEGLMILCKPCHSAKSVVNNGARRAARKANK